MQIAANEPEYRSVWDDKPKPQSDIQIYHCHNDHLGTPNELTTHEGEVVWLADYEAYGNTAKVVWREEKLVQIQVSAEELQPLRFQGQSFDRETGLHYNRFRYFDPDLGMFTTRDPIGLMGVNNVFQYAPNPTGWIDPFGLARIGNTRGHSRNSKNSAELKKNLALEGRAVKPGEAAGHIVASGGKKGHWAAAAESREILDSYGTHINDAANGIPVGHPRPHNEMHTKEFNEMVRDRIKGVRDKLKEAGRGRKAIRSATRKELRTIGKGCTRS